MMINDADADDSLDVRIDTSDSTIATATIIATDGATRTLEIDSVGAGSAMITVTVDDGNRGVANSRVSARFEVASRSKHCTDNYAYTVIEIKRYQSIVRFMYRCLGGG